MSESNACCRRTLIILLSVMLVGLMLCATSLTGTHATTNIVSPSQLGEADRVDETTLKAIDDEASKILLAAARTPHQSVSTTELCVVAGASSADREYAMIMAQSLWSGWPADKNIPSGTMKLFLYSNNRSVREERSDAIRTAMELEEWKFLDAVARAAQPYAHFITTAELKPYLPPHVRDRVGASAETLLHCDLTAALSFALSTSLCDFVLLGNGRTMFTTAVALHRFTDKTRIHSLHHLKCRGKRMSHLAYEKDESGGRMLDSTGAVIPRVLLSLGKAQLRRTAVKPERLDSLQGSCEDSNIYFTINEEIAVVHCKRANPPRHESPDRLYLAHRPRYNKYKAGGPAIAASKPTLCALVRTFHRDKRLIHQLIASLLANSPEGRIKIFLINAAGRGNATEQLLQDTFMEHFVMPTYRGNPNINWLSFREDELQGLDPFAYKVTDMALHRNEMTSQCEYFLVTNGDNMYTPDFSPKVFHVLDGATQVDLIMFNFASRFNGFVRDVAPVTGHIDLGAAIFRKELYHGNVFSQGQRTRNEWAMSDGATFGKMSRAVPPSRQAKINDAIFIHQ